MCGGLLLLLLLLLLQLRFILPLYVLVNPPFFVRFILLSYILRSIALENITLV